MTVAPPILRERIPILRDLPGEELDRLCGYSALEDHPSGDFVCEEGQRPKALNVILSGEIEFLSSCAGRSCGIAVMTQGDVFMPAAVVLDQPYVCSARAVTASRLLLLEGAAIRAEIGRGSRFALSLVQTLAEQSRWIMRQTIELKCKTAPQRAAAFLLRVGSKGEASPAELPISKRSLAARLGMTPETLSRALQILADNGLHLRGRRIIIKDPERIRRFCGGDAPMPSNEVSRLVRAL